MAGGNIESRIRKTRVKNKLEYAQERGPLPKRKYVDKKKQEIRVRGGYTLIGQRTDDDTKRYRFFDAAGMARPVPFFNPIDGKFDWPAPVAHKLPHDAVFVEEVLVHGEPRLYVGPKENVKNGDVIIDHKMKWDISRGSYYVLEGPMKDDVKKQKKSAPKAKENAAPKKAAPKKAAAKKAVAKVAPKKKLTEAQLHAVRLKNLAKGRKVRAANLKKVPTSTQKSIREMLAAYNAKSKKAPLTLSKDAIPLLKGKSKAQIQAAFKNAAKRASADKGVRVAVADVE